MQLTIDTIDFPKYVIEIGVVSANTHRHVATAGITNAELMFIHENGSLLNHIPARPVLQLTFDWAKQTNLVINTIAKCVGILIATHSLSEVDKEMNKMCVKLQNHARKIIYDNDGLLVANAPSTIKKKGFNHPLFQTGQLARSITCRALRIDKGGNYVTT